MKANELMIGDLVRVNRDGLCIKKDTVVQVRGIDGDDKIEEKGLFGAAHCRPLNEDQFDGGIWLDYLDPIPLTPEILEKSGFKKDDGVWPRYVFVADIEKYPQTIITFSFYGKGVSAETLFKCWTKPKSCYGENNIHICDLKYVHELQHALLLCGIDKEIMI